MQGARWLCFVLAGVLVPQPALTEGRRAATRRSSTTRSVYNAEAVNSVRTADPVGPGARGPAVLRAQILFDRLHYSPGEIDGHFGDDLRVMVVAFQTDHNMKPDGRIGKEVWSLLNQDSHDAITHYTVTVGDLKGPFVKVPPTMEEQAKLDHLGYATPEEELGEHFHCSPELLKTLNPGKDLSQPGQEILVPDVSRAKVDSARAAMILVSKSKRTVAAVATGDTKVATYPATIGSEHDPLPIGEWKVTIVKQNPIFFYDPALFWNANPDESKAKIAPGPNNPVGVVWIGLSKEHYGIHGTPEPGLIGHAQSHGCIRLTNWDAEELSRLVRVGTPVICQE